MSTMSRRQSDRGEPPRSGHNNSRERRSQSAMRWLAKHRHCMPPAYGSTSPTCSRGAARPEAPSRSVHAYYPPMSSLRASVIRSTALASKAAESAQPRSIVLVLDYGQHPSLHAEVLRDVLHGVVPAEPPVPERSKTLTSRPPIATGFEGDGAVGIDVQAGAGSPSGAIEVT